MDGQTHTLQEKKGPRLPNWLAAFRDRHPALWQFLLFNVFSLAATITDLTVFSLLNGWLLVPWKSVGVTWWLLRYTPEAGGLAALVATASAYLAAQIVNFFVQRKGTFHASNSVAASGVMYLVMIAAIWFFQIWFSALLLRWFVPVFGAFWGGLVMRMANGVVSLLIQFPVNKFIIMRKA